MGPKKPAKPNGFFLFACELKNTQGRKFNSMQEACQAASGLWNRMSKQEKLPYEQMARNQRYDNQSTRYTSEGLDVDVLLKEQRMQAEQEERMRDHIKQTMAVAQVKGNDGLADEVFFVIHVNIFVYYSQEDMYFPAEIAVVAFSLRGGLKAENVFHYEICPGPLPIGYKFEAQQHANETHELPVPTDESVSNMEEVFFNLKAFLEKKKPENTKRLPVLYADERYQRMVQKVLNQWCGDYGDDENTFRVYNLQMMFQSLKNTVAGDDVWPSITFSNREIEKDVYAYVPEIACTLHYSSVKPLYCSRSVVSRYVFVICDNCCPNLHIELQAGHHVPQRSSIPEDDFSGGDASSEASFRTGSSRSSRSTRERRRRYHDDTVSSVSTDFDNESLISESDSTYTSTNMDSDFPALGAKSKYGIGFGDMGQGNSSGGKSYAGATVKSGGSSNWGPTVPAAFEKRMEGLSLENRPRSRGRGFTRTDFDSGTDSDVNSNHGGVAAGSASESDFPPIRRGKGRGFVPRVNK